MKLSLVSLSMAAMSGAIALPVAFSTLSSSATPALQVAQVTARPVARVNPSRPVQIRVINAGDAPIRCGLSQPASTERSAAPGATVTFGSTSTSYLPLPIEFLVYPEDSGLGLSVDVSAANNVVTVIVGAQLANASPGRTAMNINTTGAIYQY